MLDHKHDGQRMICTGMALNVINDLKPQGKFNFLQNIRIFTEGVLESRSKVDAYITANPATVLVPHTIKTIVNQITGGINRIVGIGTKIYTGNGAVVNEKSTGYSGDPLSIVDFRPEEVVEAYAYIADRLKMAKISVGDVLAEIGITAPTKPLSFRISEPVRKIIDNITAANIGTWNTVTGSAGVPTAETRINTTILQILNDGPMPDFACIIPQNFQSSLQVGAIITINGVEEAIVEEVYPATLLAGVATIASISYDVGAMGLATIVLSTPDVSIQRNSVLLLANSEYVKVIEVTRDNNEIPSVRVETVGTFIAGNTVSGIAAFRVYLQGAHAIGETITAVALKSVIAAPGISTVEKPMNFDLTNAGGRALKDEDFLHISMQVGDPSLVTEIQVILDCLDGNKFYYIITPNFFTSSVNQAAPTLSVIQQAVQRRELLDRFHGDFPYSGRQLPIGDYFDIVGSTDIYQDPVDLTPGVIQETSLGTNQWTELFIRLGDFKKIGSDITRTKKDIRALRISANVTAGIDLWIDSIWVGGGHELETKVVGFLPYNYVWRVRDPITKIPSNWSPPLREGIKTARNRIVLTPIDAAIDFPPEYIIDIARFGGTLNDYRVIASIKNDGSEFFDETSDRTAAQNDPASRRLPANQISNEQVFDFYKPFCFLDTPKSGTCNVVGTKFTRLTGDFLDISYPRGVQILIDGKLNQFYTNPTSGGEVELEKDVGNLVAVEFEIKAPLLTGQPLPVIFGPFGEGVSGLVIFGLGNKKAAGTLYWLDGNSPDTMSDLNFLEITSPSEPLLNGIIYDGYGYIFTNKRSFMLVPTFQSGNIGFYARENAASRGIYSRWSICVARQYIYFLSENADGIYRVAGTGVPQSITDGALYNLFIHSGVNPTSIELVDGTIVNPPDYTLEEEIRLFSTGDSMMFRFVDTTGKDIVLIFDERINDWISYDTYLDNKANAFYAEEIASTSDVLVGISGGVGKFEGLTSREDNLISKVLPFSIDGEDSRLLKQFDELVLDVDKGLDGFTYKDIFNSGDIIVPSVIAGDVLHERDNIIRDINPPKGQLAQDYTTYFEWTLKSQVKLYETLVYFIPRADLIQNRFSGEDFAGTIQDKFWQGVTIEADTFGLDKEIQYLKDDGTVAATIIINHNGKVAKDYAFDIPFISHSISRIADDSVNWIPYNEEFIFDLEPHLGKVWETQETSHEIPGYKVIERIGIVARTSAVATLTIYYDGVPEVYNLNNTAGDKDKQFFFVRARKAKLLKYRLESASDFRNYLKDLEIWIRGFTSPEFFSPIRPFGDKDFETGARI